MRAFFIQKCFFAAFLLLPFGFAIFWQKNIGAKAACKMLMILTRVVLNAQFTSLTESVSYSQNMIAVWYFCMERSVEIKFLRRKGKNSISNTHNHTTLGSRY